MQRYYYRVTFTDSHSRNNWVFADNAAQAIQIIAAAFATHHDLRSITITNIMD